MPSRSPVVLIVDDHQDSLALYAVGLLAMGLEVVPAVNADEGFARACTLHPDIIVTDLRLPGVSGLDLARRLREDTRTQDAGIIAIIADPSVGQRARGAGCDRYLVKPCLPDALAREIYDVLSRRVRSGAGTPQPTGDEPSLRESPPPYRQAFERICADFQEMPDMRLTAEQVWRLCGVDQRICSRVLDDLVSRQFLRLGPDGRYLRATDGAPTRSRTGGTDAHAGTVLPISRRAT